MSGRDAQYLPISFYLLLNSFLYEHIKSSNLQGISIAERTIFISQLADDTNLFLKDSSQVPLPISLIESFTKASGLRLNMKKRELLPIKDCDIDSISNILVKKSVPYLGIITDKNELQRCTNNFTPIVEKTKKKM